MNNRSEATTQVSPLFCQNVVRNPSMFSGEISEDPQAWLKGYERVARHNHWDDSLSLANVYFYLHGTAQRWYENNEENIPSWEIFKDQLGSVFGKKDNLRRQAEQKLKVRAQTRGETTEFYIQDVLRLCREVDAQMPEEERLSHLMKGVAEEVYRYLLPRDIATTDQFIAECRRVVALQGRRVTASKFERLPNVTSLGDLGDVTDLQSLIRQIVREEVQRALAPPREEPRISSLEEIVKEEVDKVLAPMSGINTFPMESAARSAPRNYRKNTWYAPKVEASGSRVEVRDTNEWRTPDGTPICFHCGRPGHVVRYCRDRRRLLDERRDEMYQDRARTMTNSGRNNNSNDADQRVNTRRYRSPSPSPRRGSSPGRSATRRASQSPRLVKMTNNYIDIKVEGDTIRALVDSGASYSVISERFRVELKKTMFAETDVVLKVADDKVVKSKGRCTLKLEVNGHPENFEFVVLENCSHDVILGWDFFKATNAVIDCGLGELQLDDLPDLDAEGRDDGVYAIQDFVIPGRSSQRIIVVNRSLVGIVNMEVTCSKELFIRKDVIFPSSLIEFEEGIGKIWITNGGLQPQMIPKGMNLGRMCDIETEHVCLLSVEPESFSRERREDDHSDYLLSLINPDLPKKKKEDLMGLLLSFKGVFLPTMKNANKVQNRVKHRIHTGDHPPIKQRPYRVSKREREIMQKEVDTMLERKVIQPSESPWSAPVVLVKKKDGTWRFCVDFRRLNHITKKDVYPLPRIDDVLDHLSSARYYSTMDLKTGYWQVEVDERDREKTAFVTPDGLYEFMVMPFGLCNAPATFERMMDNVLMGLKWNICLCYLDDIVVYSDTFEEHLERLSKVLSCLQQAGLTINPDKCLFGSTRIKILGHVVDKDGIQPDSEKKVYQEFLQNRCSSTNSSEKDQKFIWTQEQKDSFESLKKALMQKPVLGHFKESAITKLHTDASSYGLGAVLVQIQENQENPIAYASRTLSKAEKNYSTTERECLAVIWAIGKFRPYLYGRPFEVVSDHHSLCWLAGLKDPSGRLARWALKLQDFDATITYKSGVKHKDADCLSRYPLPESPALTSLTLVREQQNLDPDITKISNALNQGEGAERFEMKNGLLYKRNFDPLGRRLLLVIPKCMRPDILKEFHDVPTAGHLGFARTYDRIRKRYFWPGLYNSVRRYVAHCKECQRRKGENKLPAGKLIPIQPPSFPFQKIGMDLLGRFPLSDKGNRWIIVCTDYLSKYAIAKALPSGTAAEIATFILEEVILKHGAPREIITDRGRAFMSQMVKEVTSRCKISHLFTTAYHPQTNGLTERLNKTLGDMLSMYVDAEQRDWDSVLPYVIFAYNTAQQGSTRFSPFFLVHGREAETLLDVLLPYEDETSDHDFGDQMVTKAEEARQLARIHILRAQENNKYHYDQVHRSVEYRVGDLVWVFTPVRKTGLSEKLLKKYFGPYKITRKVSEVNYEVAALEQSSRRRRRSQKDVVHVLRMKPYRDPGQQLVTGDYNSWDSEDAVDILEGGLIVETRSGKMQDPAQERIKAEESAKPQPGATIGRDASSDPVVLNPNIDIPKYDGTEDPRPWIESLEEIGFLYHWADYIISRYAAMNMIGSAKTWLNLHKVSFTSWENFKSRLIEDFASDANKEEMRMRLNRIQQWNEPAIRFAEDILVLCNKVDPQMEEETKINWVIGGLKKEYSFALHLNPPKNTNELLEICKKLDLFEKNYQERAEKSKALYNGPRSPRPHHQEQWKNATSFRRPYQNTSKPQAPAPRYYQNKPLPQVSAPRRSYTPNPEPKPVYPSKIYNKNPNSNRNRTEDGRPICFKCNKPGHVARYCRVRFVRIVEEDPIVTQDKVEEEIRMDNGTQKSRPLLYSDLDPKYKMNINVDRIGICEALIDTGADLSVVDLSTALNTGLEIINPDKMCSGPDGKELDIVGNIILNIKFDDKTITHQFVIMRTHLRIFILGRDFLKKMNAKIDCQREIIKYDLTENRDVFKYQQKKIKSAKDAIIPELSIKLINAFVEAEDGEYIIEENHKMFQTNGLRLARSLINVVNKETYIWITNPYPRPLKILKNQTLCFGSQPAEVNLMEESEQKEHEEPQFQINENLAYTEKEQLKQVLERYEDLFSSGLGRSNLAKHRIDTEGAKPIKHKPYRVSAKEREIIKEQIDEMLRDGIIRPSSSPWSFPVILVKKRDGKYRFCVDYRKLNDVTVKDVYPIPRIDEVLDTLQGSKYFSAIDLKSGYWQVEVEEKDKEKTAFTTAHGLYEFNVMPFGLCNAPATFERNMENRLGNLRWQICLCYLDDVIIYSSDFSTHLKRIEAVLKCFREANLKLNNKKCQFAFEELEILGHITNQQGIKPAEHNIKAIRDFPRPKKIKEVQSFLGMCSYYRKFIKGFSKIADPLTSLIKKNVPFTWTENQEKAFQTLKVALINPPILGHFDPNAITYIHTDASNIGLGATLVQKFGDKEKVISYLSRTLSKPEQNYSTTEKECLAVVWSMSKLRPYLYGWHFKIVTDHHALCWLKNLKDPTGRLARWALKIQEYNFEIIHKSGKKHLDADGLSRGPLPENEWDEDYERLFLNQIIDEKDDFIENIKENLSGNKRSITQNFKEENGCLYKKNPNPEGRAWLLVVPKKRRKEVMSEYHNHMLKGHLGVARTTYRLKNKYYWPSMLKDVSEFVKTCHLCQSRKGSNHLPSGLLQPIPPANYPFERIGIDFVGPLPSTKRRRKWIIVLTDYYTKYAETKAVSEATVKEVSTFLIEHIILRHGAPRFLISDRGSQLTSNLMKEVMKMCKVKHCFTTSYHPQTNGLTERLNRTLINMISMYVNTDQKNWDEILPFITHAYNTTIQETTGYSPFFLLFGREPMSLLDDENIPTDSNMDDYDEYIENYLDKIARTRQVVINNTEKTQERMKRNYDKKHNEKIYEPGHLVAVWTPVRKIGKCEKLLRKYFGPYRILKKLSNVNYLIEPKDNPGQDPFIVHVSRLKPYFERIDEVTHEDVTTSGEGEVMVETRSGKMQDPAQERIKAEESAKPQPGATIYKHRAPLPWNWTKEYQMLFKKCKSLLMDYGLGVILSHRHDRKEECPIAFASRTLTKAKKRFSQLEKKALSITFGVEKFRQYLLGRKFVLVTDNRPLIHIFSSHKPIPICGSSRFKRWSLKLAAFNYTVEFRKTSDNSNVDALSRLPLESSVRESLDEDQVLLRKLNEVPFSFMEVAYETPQVLRNVIEGNWKFTRVLRENPLAPYYNINEELSLEFGCLQWRERVVVGALENSLPNKQIVEALTAGVTYDLKKMIYTRNPQTPEEWLDYVNTFQRDLDRCRPESTPSPGQGHYRPLYGQFAFRRPG
ncbi:hypothetical protein LAZ67_X001713, partial [Cordylochernes scorpioides]